MAHYDRVIRGGMIVDGSRLPRFRGDIGIKDGRVAEIGHIGAGEADETIDAGGLISYGADRNFQFQRTAVYVDKILKGAKPADLPVEQPTQFAFVVNLKAAKQIGLTIPPNVLARADRVIR